MEERAKISNQFMQWRLDCFQCWGELDIMVDLQLQRRIRLIYRWKTGGRSWFWTTHLGALQLFLDPIKEWVIWIRYRWLINYWLLSYRPIEVPGLIRPNIFRLIILRHHRISSCLGNIRNLQSYTEISLKKNRYNKISYSLEMRFVDKKMGYGDSLLPDIKGGY